MSPLGFNQSSAGQNKTYKFHRKHSVSMVQMIPEVAWLPVISQLRDNKDNQGMTNPLRDYADCQQMDTASCTANTLPQATLTLLSRYFNCSQSHCSMMPGETLDVYYPSLLHLKGPQLHGFCFFSGLDYGLLTQVIHSSIANE